MKKLLIGMTSAAAIGGAALAQRERLPENCRQQIRQLCQMGGGMRQCLVQAMPKLSDDCRKAISERAAGRSQRPAGITELAYGGDPKQRLDLMVPAGAAADGDGAPLLFFVHGGGWSIGDKGMGGATKGPWANRLGWAYVSANYRLLPQVTVEQQAADLANALAWLRANARARGLDPDRIVLMGHSAGAHLVALLGTDPRYLNAAGVPLSTVLGVVLLDGAAYDVAAQSRSGTNIVKPMYNVAFGSDPKRQAALSPIAHTAPPNAAAWLILPIERRADSRPVAASGRRAGQGRGVGQRHADPQRNARHAQSRVWRAGRRGHRAG